MVARRLPLQYRRGVHARISIIYLHVNGINATLFPCQIFHFPSRQPKINIFSPNNMSLASTMKERGFTDGRCPRCRKGLEHVRHVFWYCDTVKEWWHQLQASVLRSTTGIQLQRVSFTFGTKEYASLEHQCLICHLRYCFMALVQETQKEVQHTRNLCFTAGLPLHRVQAYLTECFLVDKQVVSNISLNVMIEKLGYWNLEGCR